jgi:prepilin-type N-terminal cleavage/methylation domain-containing protein
VKHQTRGCTLLELVFTLFVIGILAAIAVPNFIAMRNRAHDAETRANMHNLQLAAEDYGVQNDGMYAKNVEDVIVLLPFFDKKTHFLPNAFTKKFTEPSQGNAPGSITYWSDGQHYKITARDHRGDLMSFSLDDGF